MPELIAHTIVIGLSIALIVGMAAVLNVLRADSQENIAAMMAENVCYDIKLAAEQLYSSSQSSVIEITLPDKIGGEPYTTTGNGHTLTVTSASTTHECIIGTSSHITGTAYGKSIHLTLSENNILISGA